MDRHAHWVPVVSFVLPYRNANKIRPWTVHASSLDCVRLRMYVMYHNMFHTYLRIIHTEHTYTYLHLLHGLSVVHSAGNFSGLPSDTTIVMSLQPSRLQSTTYALKPAYRYCCYEGMIGLFENHFDLTSKCPGGRRSRADVSLFDDDRVFFPSLLRRFFT